MNKHIVKPSKSGLIHKHIVKHTVVTPTQNIRLVCNGIVKHIVGITEFSAIHNTLDLT
jgi:hypothetical protein